MKLIVHIPQSPEKQAELKKTASKTHADAVLQILRRLPLTDEKKLRLLDAITTPEIGCN